MGVVICVLATLLPATSPRPAPAAPAAPAMDVSLIEIHTEEARFDGALGADPYGFELRVEGENIMDVSVQTPNSTPSSIPLVFTGEDWSYAEHEQYATAADLATSPTFGYGTFTFSFTDLNGGQQTATVTYSDPGATPPHTGFANVTFPASGQADVVRNPTFTWACSGAPCGNFAWYAEVTPLGSGVAYAVDLPDPMAPGWAPGLLTAHAQYELWVAAGTLIGGATQPLQTSGGDPFEYFPGYETPNTIVFSTQDWTDLFHGLSGPNGPPRLTGSGSMSPASSNALTLSGALPSTTAILVYGIAQINAPFKDGVMVPLPTFAFWVPTDLAGTHTEPYDWPAGIPAGMPFYVQAWIVDPGGPQGYAASNGVLVVSA